MNLKEYIPGVPNFPKPGITFWDVTPLLQDGEAFSYAVDTLANQYRDEVIDKVILPESRGFLIGSAVTKELGNIHPERKPGMIPARKPEKLPRELISHSFAIEYDQRELQIHSDSIEAGDRVLICDDVLATGGTVDACAQMIQHLGGEVAGACFLMNLEYVPKTADLSRYDVFSLLTYTEEDLARVAAPVA